MIVKLPNVRGWAVGTGLRIRKDAPIQPEHFHLRGTRVAVEGAPCLVSQRDGITKWEVRQRVYCYGLARLGWARPDQLEPFPGFLLSPVDWAMKEYGLTREQAEEVCEAFGI